MKNKGWKVAGIVILAIGVSAAVGAYVVHSQISRHRRNLFSRHALRRFAALGYIGGLVATVEMVQLLRDFVSWEPHRLLRRRATTIIDRMEGQLEDAARPEIVG